MTDTTTSTATSVDFPSTAWFDRLADLMTEQDDAFRKLGTIDCTMAVSIIDGVAGTDPWNAIVTFEEFSVDSVREATAEDLQGVDFVLETDLDTWREMVQSIEAGAGRPDLDYTLNRLSLAGTPIRMWSSDPLGRDMFFRVNQTLQCYVNNCGSFHTVFPGDS
jgi:hypothetical protein